MLTSGFIQIILHTFLTTGCFSQITMSPCNVSLKIDLYRFLCEGVFKKQHLILSTHLKVLRVQVHIYISGQVRARARIETLSFTVYSLYQFCITVSKYEVLANVWSYCAPLSLKD